MKVEETIAVATAISFIFFFLFRYLLSKIQTEFTTYREDLTDFKKEISRQIADIDKSLAVKSNMIDYQERELEGIKKSINNCKYRRGVSNVEIRDRGN